MITEGNLLESTLDLPVNVQGTPDTLPAMLADVAKYERVERPPVVGRVGEGALLGLIIGEELEDGGTGMPEKEEKVFQLPSEVEGCADAVHNEGYRNREVFLARFKEVVEILSRALDMPDNVDMVRAIGDALSGMDQLMQAEYISSSPELSGKAQQVRDVLDMSAAGGEQAAAKGMIMARRLLLSSDTTPRTPYDAGLVK